MEEITMTREEFDHRLAEATEKARQERLALEAENAELRDLIARYSAILERLEADVEQLQPRPTPDNTQIREILRQLAERSEAVASAL